jgi:hypothetical protein
MVPTGLLMPAQVQALSSSSAAAAAAGATAAAAAPRHGDVSIGGSMHISVVAVSRQLQGRGVVNVPYQQ